MIETTPDTPDFKATEPVYGSFGSIRCHDSEKPHLPWVYYPVDNPNDAKSLMAKMETNPRFTNLSFIFDPSKFNPRG